MYSDDLTTDSGNFDHDSRLNCFLLKFITSLIGLLQFSHRFAPELNPVPVVQESAH